MTNEVAVVMPQNIIQSAIEKGADLGQLEKIMELQERYERNEAKKAYVQAMADFKEDPPRIEKTKKVSYSTSKGVTEYKHAILANASQVINKALSVYGLSAGWKTEQKDNKITVTCTITHCQGHSESTSLTASPDDSGGKNSIQAIGSTVSYLERYTLFAITGLASHDQDDDGKKGETKYITDSQINELNSMMSENNLSHDAKWLRGFLDWLKVDTLDDLPADQYNKAKTALNDIIAKTKRGAA